MNLTIGTFAIGAVGLAALFSRQDDDPVARAGAMFEKSCIECHLPPDLRFETDRAWLHQVHDTA